SSRRRHTILVSDWSSDVCSSDLMPPEFVNAIKPTLTFTAGKVTGRPAGTLPRAFLEMAAAKGLLPKQAAAVVERGGSEGVYHLRSEERRVGEEGQTGGRRGR